MAQSSGPISQGTNTERQLTDVLWRDMFGPEPSVTGDLDGTAYKVSLSTSSDVASIGSATQRSTAQVAGFGHVIPAGEPEGITVPPASGGDRTDILGLRYDPTFTGLPGPVRLWRIAGTSTGLPAYDAAPPGGEDFPLYAITRKPGEALSQATVTPLFPRLVLSLDHPVGAPLPTSSPLGTMLRQGPLNFRRELNSGGVPVWNPIHQDPRVRQVNRNYGTGAVALPGQTFVDNNAMSVPVTVGQMLRVDLTQNVTVDGSTVQTALPNLGATGATVIASHAMATRFPPSTGDRHEDQLYRSYLLTATATTVTLSPSLAAGLGAPRLVMPSAALTVTLVESF